MTYNVNDIFTDNEEYSAHAQWCNENGCYIKEIEPLEDGSRQFKICEIEHNEELEQAEQELITTKNRINEIKDELLTAILLGDTDLQNELKEQYTALLPEDDTEDSVIAIEEVKSDKLSDLASKAQAFEQNVNKDMWFKSSVNGYLINGDRRTRSNIQDLITYQPTDNVIYRDYENIERTLTKDELKIILKEHVVNGQMLYNQKWEYEAKINACTTIEELNAIEIKFTMHDFSKEEVVADE